MKQLKVFCLILITQTSMAQVTLKGRISSKTNNEVLPGAVIYFPDYKTGAVTQADGSFELSNLPSAITLVQIKLIGYKTSILSIDLSKTSFLDLKLEEAVVEANEVVVTGVSKATEIKRNPIPMAFIDSKYLKENTATNIIDALVKVPGVNAISTGPNVSKPFIRGLGYNRILTLFDGVRQEGQQWGDEHGIEVDQYLVDRIEVVKGPASLIYGSDALGGVVNLLPENPVPDKTMQTNIQSNYQSNNGLRSGSIANNGNRNGLIWGLRASFKEATNYKNKYDGRVYNTGFKESDLNAHIGLNRKWGYSHLNFSLYDNFQEIPDGSRDSVSRKFTKQVSESDSIRPIVKENELNSYLIGTIHQRIQHYRLFSTSNFIFGKSKVALRIGYQNSIRREYSHPQSPDIAGLFLKMNTLTYDVKYFFPEKNGWEGTTGLNGMYQNNNTNDATEFVIPSYRQFDIAPFVYLKKSIGKWDIAFGARYDTRFFESKEMYLSSDPISGFDKVVSDTFGAVKQFSKYQHTFTGFSGSFGAAYNISSHLLIKANIARGFRAPNISEISAKGVHPGTGFQQLGDPNFKTEFSLQEDLGVFFDSEHISASAEIFNNLISNYIFNQKLGSLLGGDSIYTESGNEYPVFKFRQTKAQLYGGEARIDIHPHPFDWLHFENSISLVYAQNLGGNGATLDNTNKYLPYIPPVHTNSELRAEFRKKKLCFSDIFAKVDVQYYFDQNRAYLADNTETKTPGYTLIDAGIGASIKNKNDRVVFTVSILGTNLADIAYQSNMSRLKYFDNFPTNATGQSGIYNMGRNISFKITIPISTSLK